MRCGGGSPNIQLEFSASFAAKNTSPLNWITPHAAPTLCIHGTQDKYVAHEQAVWLVDRLKSAGVEADLLTLEVPAMALTAPMPKRRKKP